MKRWQAECEYFGKHIQLVPAEFARGYQYKPFDGNPVIRAIPVEGYVTDQSSFTPKAPQAWKWKSPCSSGTGARAGRAVRSAAALIVTKIRRFIK